MLTRLGGREQRRVLYAWIAAALLFALGNLVRPGFASLASVEAVLTVASFVGLVAAGQLFVILIGGIDLSVGALMAISGAVAPMLFLNPPFGNAALGIGLAFTVPVLVAGVFGLFNGSLVTRFGIQPFIATLILFIAGRGIADPTATVLSVAMMLDHLGHPDEAARVEAAVAADLASRDPSRPGTTSEIGERLAKAAAS